MRYQIKTDYPMQFGDKHFGLLRHLVFCLADFPIVLFVLETRPSSDTCEKERVNHSLKFFPAKYDRNEKKLT